MSTNTPLERSREYLYLGDRNTDKALKKQYCKAVRRGDGKCIRGRNGSMLVEFAGGKRMIVVGRLLRRTQRHPFASKSTPENTSPPQPPSLAD